MDAALVPLWLKLAYTLFVAVLVPVYWAHYGLRNFLWFSDIALLTTAAALWWESPLLAGMMVLAIALPEGVWNADFWARLLTGRHLGVGLSDYMFDRRAPRYLRALSLFHVGLPILLLWLVHRLGYDRRAWAAQSLVALLVFPLTRALTAPGENVNWVYGPGGRVQRRLPAWVYVGLLMVLFPLAVYAPTHWMLRVLVPPP